MTKPKTDPFTFHGLTLSPEGDQLVGDCPFPDCNKPRHFYASPSDWRWDCKRCGAAGNLYTFLTRLLETSLEQITSGDTIDLTAYDWLSEHRGLPATILRRHRLASSTIDGTWLLPTFNAKGNVVNLHRYVHAPKPDKPDNYELLGTPTCKAQLYGLQHFTQKRVPATDTASSESSPAESGSLSTARPVWICEGHWDYLALDHCLRKTQQRKHVDLLAVPGANVWKADWCDKIKDREVVLLYDFDEAGAAGIERVQRICSQSLSRPVSIAVLPWEEAVTQPVRRRRKRRVA